jgi:hypothetical protein
MPGNMTYEPFERAVADHDADTVGLSPGVAGVYVETAADVFCPTCARDSLGSGLFERVKETNPGYDHDRSAELGNVAAVLSSEEWDCPGARCGHCRIGLDVRVAHYDGVCRPDTCPRA